MYCFASNCFWRSSSLLATLRTACAASTCAALPATFCWAARASIRTSAWPARTRSPACTKSETMAPGTCADTVVWRTASTTASKLVSLAEPAVPCTATVAIFAAATWVGGVLSAAMIDGGIDKMPNAANALRVVIAPYLAELSRGMRKSSAG